MKRNQRAICSEMGVEKDIRDDSAPGFCKINQKRVDAFLDESLGEVLEINTADEWKRSELLKECHLAAHGGTEHCTANETKVLEWYKFVHEQSRFAESREKCVAWGGDLFYGVNGTKEQLDFFYSKLEPFDFCFWIGIRKGVGANKWITPLGEEIADELLLWSSTKNQPDNGYGNETCVLVWKKDGKIDYLHDDPPDLNVCKAVCQRVL